MARPQREGFEYFPLDVGMLDDIKVKKLSKRCGIIAPLVLIYIYALIYKDKGYYTHVDEDVIFFVSETVGSTEDEVRHVIEEAVNVNLFDGDLYEKHQVLTSHGVQKRFLKMWNDCKRKYKFDNSYLYDALLRNYSETNMDKSEFKEVNSVTNTQSKVKESKKNKTKLNKTKSKESSSGGAKHPPFRPPTREEVQAYILEKGFDNFDVEKWFNYYEANGWMIGRNKMKSWKACVCYWDRTQLQNTYTKATPSKPKTFDDKDYSEEANRW